MGEVEHYFNLILPWAVDESFILQFTGDPSALGALPTRLYGQYDLVTSDYEWKKTHSR